MTAYPSYLELYRTGELHGRIEALTEMLNSCRLCPRECKVDRISGERGVCKAGDKVMVFSASPHFGEEPPLVGWGGSGTIFLTHCNLRCIFCQNYDISHLGRGREVSEDELSRIMVNLQRIGCHNINFVTPTHYTPQIIAALPGAIEIGLQLPIVWNCGGYESADVIKLLDGIVDIYMPDIKYSGDSFARSYSKAPHYFDRARESVREMHRQVGELKSDKRGIARKGLLIRHLVMPGEAAGTNEVMAFIAGELSKETYVNIMDQYHPCYKAEERPEINRRITESEFREAIKAAKSYGLHRGFD